MMSLTCGIVNIWAYRNWGSDGGEEGSGELLVKSMDSQLWDELKRVWELWCTGWWLVNDTLLYTWKLSRVDLPCCHHKQEMVICDVMGFSWSIGNQTLGDSKGERSMACCYPWSQRVRHSWATEQQLTIIHPRYVCIHKPTYCAY